MIKYIFTGGGAEKFLKGLEGEIRNNVEVKIMKTLNQNGLNVLRHIDNVKYSAILEKVKLRGDRQRMTLEELVLQYQTGDTAVFDTIYQMTESERESTVRRLRTATPSTLSFPELYAMYDDALFIATETYAEGHNCKFITHLNNVLDNLRLKEIERVGAAKRGANVDSISFQQEMH